MFFSKKRINRAVRRIEDRYNEQLDNLRCRIDLDPALFDRFQADRVTEAYKGIHDLVNPLVTVCIATYNRGKLVVERSIRSVLDQTYSNLELIVVGDCCTDDTAERVAEVKDERLRFVNLEQRGNYPDNPKLRWMVAGTIPMNHALDLAKGHYITHLDDDDRFPPDRLEKLVAFMKKTRADFIWHPFKREQEDGEWLEVEARHYAVNQVTTSSVFYHRWLRRIKWDLEAYRMKEPGDWNRFRKLRYMEVDAVRYPESLLFHYKERNQRDESISV